MKLYNDLPENPIQNAILTVGMFDGVHVGHQKVLHEIISSARHSGGQSVLLTFWPHPRFVFEGENCSVRYLTTLAQKIELLERLGLDHLIILPFTRAFSELSPQEYISEILVKRIGTKKIIVGYDHRFGHKGQGDFTALQNAGREYYFEVEQINALLVESEAISSTKIRKAIDLGNVEFANIHLGYNYSISGTIVRGKQLGRTIGYPTANLQADDSHKQIPGHGVYVSITRVNGSEYASVTSIGVRPTVDDSMITSIETYIFDFSEDIYGSNASVFFLKKLRDELKFSSLDDLIRAIDADVLQTKQYFAQLAIM